MRELDRVSVIVVVDNESDGLSTPCAGAGGNSCCNFGFQYNSEMASMVQRIRKRPGKLRLFDFKCICNAAHGYALYIQAEAGGETHTMLFDAGPTGEVMRANSKKLELDMGAIEALVLSHWHIDHSGGYFTAVEDILEARRGRGDLLIDLHPDRPAERGLQFPDGYTQFNPQPEWSFFERPGAVVDRRKDTHLILDRFFLVSGEIPRVTSYEQGLPGHCTLNAAGEWLEDPLIMDERYLAFKIKGRGVVVISSCSHAGIVNVVKDIRAHGEQIHAFMGGLHLAGEAVERIIKPTVNDLRRLAGDALCLPGHCTGWRAKMELQKVFDEQYQPTFVGSRLAFSAPSTPSVPDVPSEPDSKRQKVAVGQ